MLFRSLFSTATKKTFYEILQVPHNSDLKEIKSKYFKLCKLLHPDTRTLISDDELTEFHDLLKAYETLKDPAKRREYDRSLALTAYKAPATSLKDFDINSKVAGAGKTTMDFWRKVAASRKESLGGRENETERLEDIRLFRNRIIVIGAILIGYWFSTLRSK